MKTTQPTQPNSIIVFAKHLCKIRLTAKILPSFLVALFAILSAAPTHAATPAQPLVAAGESHSMFVKSDGTLWAMGDNTYGQLGVGDTTRRTSPVQVTVPNGLPVIAVATSCDTYNYNHSLFVTSDGSLWAMGANSVGQLGDGTTFTRTTPVQVKYPSGVPVTNVIALAAGGGSNVSPEGHSLFVTSDGKLWAMGNNSCGQLGDGSTTNPNTPVQVAANVVAVAAGANHSLFVKSDGTLWAMGFNSYGQLGDGTTITRTTPVPVATSTNVIAVAAGEYQSLFVTSDGKLWDMGMNAEGADRTSPVQVAANVIAVAAGEYQSLFVTSDGTLWTMGDNSYGQLGDGTTITRTTPAPVATNVIAVAAGYSHSLFVTSDGKLWATGNNSYGQLGDGTTIARSTPVLVATGLAGAPTITITFDAQGGTVSPTTQTATQNYTYGTTLPTPLRSSYTFLSWWTSSNGTGTQITATTTIPTTNQNLYAKWTPYTPPPPTLPLVAAGEAHSLFVTSDGRLWGMGNNSYGQLGDGTTITRTSPAPVAANVIAVAAGGNHSLFVKSDGTLWAMGDNGSGALGLGDGTYTNRSTPVQVAANVIAVAAGANHSLFVKSDGTLCAMGWNSYGQLGDGTTTAWTTPVQVATNVIAVAAGANHSLFVKSDGTLWAMGWNYFGQLGDGTAINRSTPVQVAANVIAVAAGGSHSLFVKSDGTLWAMGGNGAGQLGDGTTISYSPVQVATNVIAVAADNGFSLFVTSDGTLWTVGNNSYGQLGDGTTTNCTSPVQVMVFPEMQAPNVIAVTAGGDYSLYITSDGKLWGMGYNGFGQLGDGTTTNRPSPVQVASGLADSPSPLTIVTITFDAQGGSVSSTTQIAALNYLYCTLPTPTRDGYTFGGWWTGPNGTGTQITAATTVTTAANQPLYAKWTQNVLPALTVDKIILSLAQPATTTDTFDITSNIPWTAQIQPAFATWLAVYPPTGNGSAAATATTISENTTGAPRTAYIVVNGGGITRTLIATQAATTTPGLAPAALSIGATLTLTIASLAPATLPVTRTYTIVTGTTLTTTDASGTLTLAYEYNASGDTGILIIPDLDSVYSLHNAITDFMLYTFDDEGTYELGGNFTYAPPAATYTLTVANGTGSGAYTANTPVPITANDAPPGKVFDHWTTSNGGAFANANAATTTFTMPAAATTVTATYKTATTGGGGNTGGGSGSGSGGGGGGAPSLLYLGAAVALAALRGAKRK